MNLNELATTIHEAAKDNGWYTGPSRSPLEIHMLMVSEIAEATEEARTNNPPYYETTGGKPCGEATEIADVIIRALDYCAYREWDIQSIIERKIDYNAKRGFRHGGKRF